MSLLLRPVLASLVKLTYPYPIFSSTSSANVREGIPVAPELPPTELLHLVLELLDPLLSLRLGHHHVCKRLLKYVRPRLLCGPPQPILVSCLLIAAARGAAFCS